MSLLKQAAQAGFMMWRQPLDVQIRGFDRLRSLRFATDGLEAKTHLSQLNPGSQPRNNASVGLVVQPGFVARQRNGAEKVWGQAEVLWLRE